MKKILCIFRFTFIGCIWTFLFFIISNYVIYKLWNFNFMSARSWQTISTFWNKGGVINTFYDYLFFIVLFSLPFIWIICWKKLLKINYTSILLSPLTAYNRHVIKKYGQDSSRIVLKNIKSSQVMIEEIKEQLESIKPEKSKETLNIRAEINKKLNQINK